MSHSENRASRRRWFRSCRATLVTFALLGLIPICGDAQDTSPRQPPATSSADPRQDQPPLLVDALFAKHHHRANQDPEWAVSTAGCLDHLSEARPHDVKAHEEAEKLRSGQWSPESADRINAAATQRNAGIERYNGCLRGSATFTLPAVPSPTPYAKIGKFIEVATAKAVDGLIRILEERFGRAPSSSGSAGASGGNQAPGARKPTNIPPEHLPLYYGSLDRPEPMAEFAHGVTKGIWAAEVEDLPSALVNPAKRLEKYKRLAATVAALSTGNSIVDLYNQLRQVDPTAPSFDLGYQAGRILRQGANLRDMSKLYARRPGSVAGATKPKPVRAARPPGGTPDEGAPGGDPSSGGAPGGGTAGGAPPGGGAPGGTTGGTTGGGVTRPPSGSGSVHPPTGYVLGKELGHGSFGKVYELEGQPDKVLKQVWVDPTNPFSGRASVRRQTDGYDLLTQTNADPTKPAAKDPIPMTTLHEARTPSGQDPYLVMEHATAAPRWKAKGAYVKAQGDELSPDEQHAMRELGQKLADNDLVWSDPNPGNVSFFTEGGVLKAAVIDHDFIFPAKQAEAIAQSMRRRLGALKNPNDPAAVNRVLRVEERVMFQKLRSSRESFEWLRSYLDGGAFSAEGFMDAMASANGYR